MNTMLFMQVPVGSWFDDSSDSELLDLMPLFESLAGVDNVYSVLKTVKKSDVSS